MSKYYIGFLKKVLRVKQSTNSCVVYAETGCFPLSLYIQRALVKYWLKVINSDDNMLINITYSHLLQNSLNNATTQGTWMHRIRTLFDEHGLSYVWRNQQEITDEKLFLDIFETRSKDAYRQQCFNNINNSTRCRLYKGVKTMFQIEPYLQYNINCDMRAALSKIRLSSHKFMVERGRWSKPKIDYIDRKYVLCMKNDIQDEYHILMICPYLKKLRHKYINHHYYMGPSMFKFQELLNTVNTLERFKLMLFTKYILKQYDSTINYLSNLFLYIYLMFLFYFLQSIFLVSTGIV